MLTFLPLEQIAELEQQMRGDSYRPNTAQELLAREVLMFVHGEQGLQAALQATQVGCLPAEVCIWRGGTALTGAAGAGDSDGCEAEAGEAPSVSNTGKDLCVAGQAEVCERGARAATSFCGYEGVPLCRHRSAEERVRLAPRWPESCKNGCILE